MPRDEDGFLVPHDFANGAIMPAAPERIDVGPTFDDCPTPDHAAAKAMTELGKPASVQIDGIDTLYRRLADGLLVLLADLRSRL